MLKKIANIFYDIRKGEWASAFLMFLLHFFLMVALYLLKPARDSLFLVEIGPKQLPLVYILLALVAIPVTQLLSNMTQKYDVKKVLHWSLLILILNLLILRWLLWLRDPWIYMVFYIWVGIFGLLVISQFWLYANGLYDAAQSKRLFSFLNLGAIIGAIAGSGASSLLVSNLGLDTRNLLYACIGILLVCVLIFRYLKQMQPAEEPGTLPEEERRTSAPEIIKTVFKSRYQLILAGIIGMTMLATTLVDYQFKSIAYDAYPVTAELTSFMGKFYGGLSFASFLIQILLSASIIRRLGLGGAVLSRPVGLTIGSILLMIEPVLATAVFIRGYDDATRYSIDKTGRELLYLPLSQRVKKKTKVFLDIFVDRFFRGIAGVFLLIFIFVIDLSVQQISFFVLIVTGCWITLGVMARREYVHKFRDSLSRRYVDPDNIALDLDESSLYESVRQALQSDNSSQILYVLNLVRGSDVDKLAGELSDLLHHQSSEIRHRALELLGSIQDQHYVDDVKKLLQDEDPDVRLEAIYYLCQHSEEDPSRVIQSYLDHSNEKLRSAALGCVSKHSTDGEGDQAIDESLIEELLNDKSRESVVISAQVAQALGYLSEGEKPRKYLPRLLNAKARSVAKAAIESVQRLKDDYFISDLLDKLDEPDLNLEVRNALASFGEDYLPLYKQK
ncbi:MAG: Npt1/Npt2 family nucleotide transporter, partial [Balneolaceae bacterium]|nr:Npt1/Npt2 family nucleotide transporter [Balneolaceae bacterium]